MAQLYHNLIFVTYMHPVPQSAQCHQPNEYWTRSCFVFVFETPGQFIHSFIICGNITVRSPISAMSPKRVSIRIKTNQWLRFSSVLEKLGQLTLKVLNFWKCTSYCSLKPLWSGMGEVVPARTSPTLHPPSPRTVHQLLWLALQELIHSWCRNTREVSRWQIITSAGHPSKWKWTKDHIFHHVLINQVNWFMGNSMPVSSTVFRTLSMLLHTLNHPFWFKQYFIFKLKNTCIQVLDTSIGFFFSLRKKAGARATIKVSGHQYRWLAGGYDLEIGHF